MRELNIDLLGVHYFPHLLPNYRRLVVIDALTAKERKHRSEAEFLRAEEHGLSWKTSSTFKPCPQVRILKTKKPAVKAGANDQSLQPKGKEYGSAVAG